MSTTSEHTQLQAEYAARIEEYKVVTASMAQHVAFSSQVLSITLTLVGILIAGSDFLLSKGSPFLFVVASWLFLAVVWTQLRFALVVVGLSNHVINVIEPAVRECLRSMCPDGERDLSSVLPWESHARHAAYGPVWIWPILLSRYCVPLITAVVCFCTYLDCVTKPLSVGVLLLCTMETALVLYTLAVIYWIARRATSKPG